MNCNLFGLSRKLNEILRESNEINDVQLSSLVYGNSYNTTMPLIIRYLLGYCDLIKE